MNAAQNQGLEELHAIEKASGNLLRVHGVSHVGEEKKSLAVELSLECSHYEKRSEGLVFESREEFIITIPVGFPFHLPEIKTKHTRFAGNPHVQWGQCLCLYQAPGTEWDPSDGMFGFIERLHSWLDHASRGELDPTGAPLHPPVTYATPGVHRTAIVVRADAPRPSGNPWVGFAHLKEVTEYRADIVAWSERGDLQTPPGVACALLLVAPLQFEYPTTVRALYTQLSQRDIPLSRLLASMIITASNSENGHPLYVVVGAPMRGIRGGLLKQHLAIWRISSDIADLLRISLRAYEIPDQAAQDIGDEATNRILDWANHAPIEWCKVLEDRPEIVQRRDYDSSTSWFTGKVISLWGCGALGGAVAECLARSGARKLILRDSRIVTAGILVRQLYDDIDIGKAKSRALRERLLRIRPTMEVEAIVGDILSNPLDSENWTDNADIIIDTTASGTILAKLEKHRRCSVRRVTVASMVIGHRADRCFVVVSRAEHSGGPQDVCRKAKLEVLNRLTCGSYADEFWPIERTKPFQPEPGCSEPTFIGSMADVMVLAGTMVNAVGKELASDDKDLTAAANFYTLPDKEENGNRAVFRWSPDNIVNDPHSGAEIRIAESAWDDIQAWISRNNRLLGSTVETGGMIFGERDDSVGVIWVNEASGPPRDSEASSLEFICGVEGVASLSAEKQRRSRGTIQALGTWHSHPTSAPLPSTMDFKAMATILNASSSPLAKSLLLIVGHTQTEKPLIGAYEFSKSEVDERIVGGPMRECELRATFPRRRTKDIGLALSGGGSHGIPLGMPKSPS